jgi:hypothetical protein
MFFFPRGDTDEMNVSECLDWKDLTDIGSVERDCGSEARSRRIQDLPNIHHSQTPAAKYSVLISFAWC